MLQTLLALADPVADGRTPSALWTFPFVALLLAIAVLPLIRRTQHWWESNWNRLLVSCVLGAIALAYYGLRDFGYHHAAPGLETVGQVLRHAILDEYVPFIVLLLSLYVIAGGIVIRGDLRATPLTNSTILAIGGVLANLIGTTGASMLLIRLVLRTNRERRHVVHTIVFFIFIVSNVGGCLLPIGDPPLFLGYLAGVPFFWTLRLTPEWLVMMALLLATYYAYDTWQYRQETVRDIRRDDVQTEPLRMLGASNIVWMVVVVAAVATVTPAKPLPGTNWTPPEFLREGILLACVGLSLSFTPRALRQENGFNYHAINEVAALFLGIFVTMQVPLEILGTLGPKLADQGFTQPWQFFWATGVLSSFLDNAPTYKCFLETALSLPHGPNDAIVRMMDGREVRADLLVAISLGAVFMGANTYIGNGPNFMVKAIAEHSGVRMPSFFGFMAYSGAILIPLFVLVTLIFLR